MRWRRQPLPPWRVVVVDGYPRVKGGAHVVARDIHQAGTVLNAWSTEAVMPEEGPAAVWLREQGVPVTTLRLGALGDTYGGAWRTHRLRTAWALFRCWARLRKCLEGDPILHVHDHRGLVLALPFVVLGRGPVVWHVHNADSVGSLGKALSRLALRRANVTVVPSRVGAPGIRGERVVELPNAVHEPARAVETKALRVVTVGRLHPSKGQDVLIRAVSLLNRRGLEPEVIVVGAAVPGEEAYANRLRREASKVPGVRLVGPVDDAADVMATAQVYVQPSFEEPFGLAALEASSAGVPVVASEVGGLAGLIVHSTGILVPPGDPVALSEALFELLSDPSLARKLGANGRRRAMEHYSLSAFASSLQHVYELATGHSCALA